MQDHIEPRSTQTKIKHQILEAYLKKWGWIILNGMSGLAAQRHAQGKGFRTRFVYVDCNASCGRYRGETEDQAAGREPEPVPGSPIIGVKALDGLVQFASSRHITLQTNAILIEEKSWKVEELRESLRQAGVAENRIVVRNTIGKLTDGQIVIVQGDSTMMVEELNAFTQADRYAYSFFFLDPYGPEGIPLSFVGKIISQPRHDVIINMPYQDLHKKAGWIDKPDSRGRETLKHYNAMFGHSDWQEIVRQLDFDAILQAEAAEAAGRKVVNQAKATFAKKKELELVQAYWASLQDIDEELAVKKIPLRFQDRERTMFYLYLTTHDPTGALAINELLWDAEYEEDVLRDRFQVAKQSKRGTQTSIFDYVSPTQPDERQRPKIEDVAEGIAGELGGMVLPLREVYRAFGDSTYFAEEIKKALAYLKKNKRAKYSSPLVNDTEITILS